MSRFSFERTKKWKERLRFVPEPEEDANIKIEEHVDSAGNKTESAIIRFRGRAAEVLSIKPKIVLGFSDRASEVAFLSANDTGIMWKRDDDGIWIKTNAPDYVSFLKDHVGEHTTHFEDNHVVYFDFESDAIRRYWMHTWQYQRLMEIIDDRWLKCPDAKIVRIDMEFEKADGQSQTNTIAWVNPEYIDTNCVEF